MSTRFVPIAQLPAPEDGAAPVPAATAAKGRGTGLPIAGRFERRSVSACDDGWGALDQTAEAAALPRETCVVEERARSVLSTQNSPDISFDLSVNPYRGCEHGCVYCFARPTHSYLDLSPGLDFETRIVAKVNAAERLREAFLRPAYVPRLLNIGSATDAYQPVERRLGITRSVIGVLTEFGHPFSLLTKSSGVERDLDLIAPMARRRLAAVYVSLTTLDPALARILEPRAAAPHRRLATITALARAGVPVGVSVSPVIPFINEPEIERIVEAAAAAGATTGFSIVLRPPWEVNPIFQQWLAQHFPERADRVMARVREIHGGRDYDASFGRRMTGRGVWAELLRQRFDKAAARFGLGRDRVELDLGQFRRPAPATSPTTPKGSVAGVQADLFG